MSSWLWTANHHLGVFSTEVVPQNIYPHNLVSKVERSIEPNHLSRYSTFICVVLIRKVRGGEVQERSAGKNVDKRRRFVPQDRIRRSIYTFGFSIDPSAKTSEVAVDRRPRKSIDTFLLRKRDSGISPVYLFILFSCFCPNNMLRS